MIFTIYITFLALALIFLIIGLYSNNMVLNITAGALLIFLGATVMINGYDYPTGSALVASTVGNITTTTETITYANESAKTIGIFILLVGFGAFILTLLDQWRARR